MLRHRNITGNTVPRAHVFNRGHLHSWTALTCMRVHRASCIIPRTSSSYSTRDSSNASENGDVKGLFGATLSSASGASPSRPNVFGSGANLTLTRRSTVTDREASEGPSYDALMSGEYTETFEIAEDDNLPNPNSITDGSNSGSEGSTNTGPTYKATFEVLRLDPTGRARQTYARRRDLLREYKLQPRDLRRIDPSVDVNRTRSSITVKDNVILLCLGGVRVIVTAEKALLFEPQLPASRKFLEVVQQHMQSRHAAGQASTLSPEQLANASHNEYMSRYYQKADQALPPPFELEVIEAALMVATGRIDSEMASVTQRVQLLLSKLPRDINPVNLEELRKVKGALVELEQKADTLRNLLEELMDDEDELRELNLSSRPRREERRRQRERERLERELERAREIKEEIEEHLEDDEQSSEDGSPPVSSSGSGSGGGGSGGGGGSSGGSSWGSTYGQVPRWYDAASPNAGQGQGPYVWRGPAGASSAGYGVSQNGWTRALRLDQVTQQQQQQLQQQHGASPWQQQLPGSSKQPAAATPVPQLLNPSAAAAPTVLSREQRQHRIQELRSKFDRARLADLRAKLNWSDRERDRDDRERERDRERDRERERERRRGGSEDADDREGWISRLEGSEEDIQEAQEALEEMVEQEEEEQEVEEAEDLLEYYLQRASATQDEAERLLADARDLEESIGISLSARRYEVNRLELTLSIGSFAAAIGAMVAGIFGMNMRSMLEASVMGFWGVSLGIMLGCLSIFLAIMAYTRSKRIL